MSRPEKNVSVDMPENTLRHTFLVECSRDDVGLWLVARWVRKQFGLSKGPGDEAELREKTLALLGALLRDGLIQAGHPDPGGQGFASWSLSGREVVARIRREWEVLGRTPRLGEVVWFTATAQGEQKARRARASSTSAERRRGTLNIGDHPSVG